MHGLSFSASLKFLVFASDKVFNLIDFNLIV